MVKSSNKRIMITLSSKQVEWLDGFCKNHDITASKYISWLLSKKAEEMLVLIENRQPNWWEEHFTIEELTQIAKADWLKGNN